jgi:hypothetical protein
MVPMAVGRLSGRYLPVVQWTERRTPKAGRRRFESCRGDVTKPYVMEALDGFVEDGARIIVEVLDFGEITCLTYRSEDDGIGVTYREHTKDRTVRAFIPTHRIRRIYQIM